MTIRITNKCNQYCTHCMQESGPKENEFMSLETFENTLEFINSTSTKVINISGGEATLHPEIISFLKLVVKYNKAVVLLTNGTYLIDNPKLRHEIFCLMAKHKNLFIQVTSVKNIYSMYITKTEFTNALKPLVIFKKIKDRITFENSIPNGIVPIGRALDNYEKFDVSLYRESSQAPRCFNLYNALSHLDGDLIKAISYVKTNSATSLCIPLIKENGDVMFGEYGNTCNVVYNVNNEDKNPILNMRDILGPCGKCYINKTQELNVNNYLNCYPNKHNKLTESLLYKKDDNSKYHNLNYKPAKMLPDNDDEESARLQRQLQPDRF